MGEQRQDAEISLAAEVKDLWKSFGGIPVLKGVSLTLRRGEIHALAGGNGAGKSTLMKALTGVINPDSGKICISGKEIHVTSPRQAHANAIYMIPQEPQLFPNLSVQENLSLALEGVEASKKEISDTLRAIAPHIALDTPASELPISDQQIIEIVRGVLRKAKVLIVDEPTAALTVSEAEKLFGHLRNLAKKGVGIFYITHRLGEIFDLCNRVTVLRDGGIALQKDVVDTTVEEIIQKMVPASEKYVRDCDCSYLQSDQEPALEIKNLSGQGFSGISLKVQPGEIVGIAGLVGSGRTEFAETIYGIRPGSGTIQVGGKLFTKHNPRHSLQNGLAYVPEDRHRHGVFLLSDIIDNTTCSVLPSISKFGVISKSKEISFTQKLMDQLSLQKGDLRRKVGSLSGGNQQKVSLGKALASNPKVIILDEPSRGVDIGARGDLYRLIGDLAKKGTAVIVISSDFDEVVEVSHRVMIMRQGTLTTELCGEKICFTTIRDCCFGLEKANA